LVSSQIRERFDLQFELLQNPEQFDLPLIEGLDALPAAALLSRSITFGGSHPDRCGNLVPFLLC
jgi:hypothetical protein